MPTMPQLLSGDAIGSGMQVEQDEPYGVYLEDYRILGNGFQEVTSFTEFFHLKQKN
jgi:hypothetical protein